MTSSRIYGYLKSFLIIAVLRKMGSSAGIQARLTPLSTNRANSTSIQLYHHIILNKTHRVTCFGIKHDTGNKLMFTIIDCFVEKCIFNT